jgi:hypothetical protein
MGDKIHGSPAESSLCIIMLDLRAQDDVLIERKRCGFDYLVSLLSIRKNLLGL